MESEGKTSEMVDAKDGGSDEKIDQRTSDDNSMIWPEGFIVTSLFLLFFFLNFIILKQSISLFKLFFSDSEIL